MEIKDPNQNVGGFDDEQMPEASAPVDKKRERKKRLSGYERHLIACPKCGKDVLDHFTECPHCGIELKPRGYSVDEVKLAKVKRIAQIVGLVLTIGLVAAIAIVIIVKSGKEDNGKDFVAPSAYVQTID